VTPLSLFELGGEIAGVGALNLDPARSVPHTTGENPSRCPNLTSGLPCAPGCGQVALGRADASPERCQNVLTVRADYWSQGSAIVRVSLLLPDGCSTATTVSLPL
jgi:hypothetical protein